MIDEQSSASGHDYASDRSAIGAGLILFGVIKYGPFSKWPPYKNVESNKQSILASKLNITAPAGQRSICRKIVVYTGI